jgi:hypothetical protein
MSIQPGNGYTFTSSGQGTTLNIDAPWTPPIGDALVFAPQVAIPASTYLPEQLVYGQGVGARPSPFECQIVSINGERFLQIAVGAINYTSSLMPEIYYGNDTRIMQAYANKVQICPSGMRTNGDLYPIYPDNDPTYSLTWWMEDGGGYKLSDSDSPLALYAFKWDVAVGVSPFSESSVVNTGLPTLALIADSNSTDQNKIAVDPSPSTYVQTMNVQKMTGYDAASTGLDADWGHGHTSWLNPRKLGYSYKYIAAITAESNSFSMVGSIERVAIPLIQNQVQHISLVGKASGGAAYISCGAVTSVIPFPVTTFWSGSVPVYSDELTMAACLNSIPDITITVDSVPLVIPIAGNVEVSKTSAGSYYVTFCNNLSGINLPQLTFNTGGVTAYSYDFKITQYHTGSIDLITPTQTGMVQLRNVAGLDETDDAYNANEEAEWDQIANKEQCVACTDFSGDVITGGMYNMTGATAIPVQYDGGAYSAETLPPFTVYAGTSEGTWKVQAGTLNDYVPDNMESEISTAGGMIYLKISNTDGAYPGDTLTIETDTTTPEDTDEYGYITLAEIVAGVDEGPPTVNQFVSGSLWSERHKFTEPDTSLYYYYRI